MYYVLKFASMFSFELYKLTIFFYIHHLFITITMFVGNHAFTLGQPTMTTKDKQKLDGILGKVTNHNTYSGFNFHFHENSRHDSMKWTNVKHYCSVNECVSSHNTILNLLQDVFCIHDSRIEIPDDFFCSPVGCWFTKMILLTFLTHFSHLVTALVYSYIYGIVLKWIIQELIISLYRNSSWNCVKRLELSQVTFRFISNSIDTFSLN